MRDEITVTLEEQDFISALLPQPRPRRLRFLLLLLALMVALLIVALLASYPEARLDFRRSPLIIGLLGAVILAAILVLLLLAAAPAIRRRVARSILNDHPGMRDPIQIAFDDERFEVRTTYTQANYPWSQLWDWRETERLVIVLPTPRNYYLIPKRALEAASLDRLRSCLGRARNRMDAGFGS
jgi:hypothetical protein